MEPWEKAFKEWLKGWFGRYYYECELTVDEEVFAEELWKAALTWAKQHPKEFEKSNLENLKVPDPQP